MMPPILTAIGGFFKGISWKVWAGLAALSLILGGVWYCTEQVDKRVEQAEVVGSTTERNVQLEQTIENVKKAENARDEITDPGPAGDLARYDQCVRTARTPANCERFLPSVQPTDS